MGKLQNAPVMNDAWSDLLRRNEDVFPLKQLGLGCERPIRYDDINRLVLAAMDKEEPFWDYVRRCYPNACGCVWGTLPGYSRDGKTAVVGFARPSYHGESWTYILRKSPAGWEISKRERQTSD